MPRPIANPPNPWQEAHVEWGCDGDAPPTAELEIHEEETKRALSRNDSPDVGFRWSLNPYRGCYHGCAYCYARPSHQYWGFGAGTDFERRIVVKTNVAERLREELERRSWRGETIAFSGNTDCYQPLEAAYRLTRRCLEVCLEYRNPVGLITKGSVIRRDIPLLSALAREARVHVTLSIPFADDAMARRIEPWASPPSRRFETLRFLAEAGIPTGIGIAPVIPGLNDADIPTLLQRAADAGATSSFMTAVRLPGPVREIFDVRLEEVLPARAAKVRNGIREMRGGRMNDPRFGARMSGVGSRWQMVEAVFEAHRKRLGLVGHADERPTTFRRPRRQLGLFD